MHIGQGHQAAAHDATDIVAHTSDRIVLDPNVFHDPRASGVAYQSTDVIPTTGHGDRPIGHHNAGDDGIVGVARQGGQAVDVTASHRGIFKPQVLHHRTIDQCKQSCVG